MKEKRRMGEHGPGCDTMPHGRAPETMPQCSRHAIMRGMFFEKVETMDTIDSTIATSGPNAFAEERAKESPAFADSFQRARDATAILTQDDEHMDAVHEAIVERQWPAATLAHLLRQYLPQEAKMVSAKCKKFWIDFAEELGPDWIAEFKRVADFMNEVDNF